MLPNIKLFDLAHSNNGFFLCFESRIPCVTAILTFTWELENFLAKISALAINSAMFLVFLYLKFNNSKRKSTNCIFLSTSSIPNKSKNSFFNVSQLFLIAGDNLLYYSSVFSSKLLWNKIRRIFNIYWAFSILFASLSALCLYFYIQLSSSRNSLRVFILF